MPTAQAISFDIPEWSGESSPFSRGANPKYYRPQDLKDVGTGKTARTDFFEKTLVGLFWKLDRSVPYAFKTLDGKVRSLDAGCLKFLANRNPPEIEFECDADGYIFAVRPLPKLLSRYERMRPALLSRLSATQNTDTSISANGPADNAETLLPSAIENALLGRGFSRSTTEYIKRFDHPNCKFPLYLKVPQPGHDRVRRCLVVHPETDARLLNAPGISRDAEYYHHSNLRAFPDRMHTGQTPRTYGVALDVADIAALNALIDGLLKPGQNPSQTNLEAAKLTNAGVGYASQARAYWWVNQNQTYRDEIDGGFLWSPKLNKDNRRNPFYEYMTHVQPGDVIFSFCDTQIKSIGIAVSRATSAPKPEFKAAGKNWSNEGWLIRVVYHELERPLRPKDFIERLRSELPKHHSPLQTSGNGNQGVYLTTIPDGLAAMLIELMRGSYEQAIAALDGDRRTVLDQATEDKVQEKITERTDIGELQKERLIKARSGQGVFRKNVMLHEKCCRVTKVSDERYLIASHIKPWALSDDVEKISGSNGLLLAPHVDRLFDRGFISFEDNGDFLCSPLLPTEVLVAWGISPPINVGLFSAEQCKFLAYHRENRFIAAP